MGKFQGNLLQRSPAQ